MASSPPRHHAERPPAAEQNRAELARRRGLDLQVVEPSIDERSGRAHGPDRTGRYRKARPLRPARTAPAPAPRLVGLRAAGAAPAVQALMGRMTGMPRLGALSSRLAVKQGNDGLPVQGSPHPVGSDANLRVETQAFCRSAGSWTSEPQRCRFDPLRRLPGPATFGDHGSFAVAAGFRSAQSDVLAVAARGRRCMWQRGRKVSVPKSPDRL